MQDPKRKVHKPVKATLRLEVERLPLGWIDSEALAESRRISNGSAEGSENFSNMHTERTYTNGVHGLHRGPYNDHSDLKDTGKPENLRTSGGESGSSDVRSLFSTFGTLWIIINCAIAV